MKHHRTVIACCAAGIVPVILAGCGSRATSATQTSSNPRNPLEITVRPDLMQQVKVGGVPWRDVRGTLTVAAHIESDERRLARVSAPVAGRIVELEAAEGQQVLRGQVLATIHSTELASAQSAFLKAATQKQLAERAVARARQLLDAGVIGSAELQRREAELEQAGAEVSSSEAQLRVLGMTDEAIARLAAGRSVNPITQIRSTLDGTVLERKVTIGQVVQAAETVCLVADLSSVWLVADVPEQSAGAMTAGKSVDAEMPAFPRLKIAGALSYVGVVVNPETRTVRVRMDLPNPDRRFKPDMLATMALMDGAQRKRVVPLDAIVRENNEDDVLLETAPRRFLLHRVTLGGDTPEGRVLEAGLGENDRIILDGAFHINNERKRLALGGE